MRQAPNFLPRQLWNVFGFVFKPMQARVLGAPENWRRAFSNRRSGIMPLSLTPSHHFPCKATAPRTESGMMPLLRLTDAAIGRHHHGKYFLYLLALSYHRHPDAGSLQFEYQTRGAATQQAENRTPGYAFMPFNDI